MLNLNFMTRVRYFLIILFGILLFFALTFEAKAQNDFGDRIEKIKLDKMIKKLNLDENTTQTFTERYKSFSSKIRELNKKRFNAYKLMVENLESGSGLDTLVSQVISYEEEIISERVNFAEDMKTLLTTKQVATMIIFERKFNNEIRKLLKDFKKGNKGNKD
jgi:hypothetical protein